MGTALILAVLAILALALFQGIDNFIPTPQDELLRIQASGTITTTTPTGNYDMGPGFAPGGPGQAVAAVINATAVDRADSNETYVFQLEESDNGSSGWTACSVSRSITAVGTYSVIGFANRRFLRLTRTLGGTTPSLTSEVFVNFNIT